MLEKGLVSVVIPTYNRAGTIVRAVESVLNQDYPLVEVIVIDDGSKDDTPERVSKRFGEDQRVRYFRIPNSGVCGARNRGLKEVRGEFVAMLDSDDYWLPGKLSLQIGVLQKHPELSMVWSDMDAIDEADNLVARRYLRTMYASYRYFPSTLDLFDKELKTEGNIPYYIGRIARAIVIGNLVHTSTVMARTECIFKAGEYDQSVHPAEDQDYYYRLCLTGPVALIDTVTIHYQVGAADAASGEARFYEVAVSAMKVFNRLRGRSDDIFPLSKELIEQKETDLNRWVGLASFHKGKIADARHYLKKRLMHNPNDKASLIYFILTFLPFSYYIFIVLQRLRDSIRKK